MVNRMVVEPHSATVVEGPAFEITTEDGPGSTWSLFVEVQHDSQILTYRTPFARNHREVAQRLADRVNAAGTIDPNLWERGDCWASVHGGETMVERLGPYGTEWQREQDERRSNA